MNISITKVEEMHFDNEIMEELSKFAKTYHMKVTYYYGYIVEFDKVNVHAITPHKIVFTKYDYSLDVLYYDYYYEGYDVFFIDGQKVPLTMGGTKKYVREYFSNIFKMHIKKVNK